MKQTILITGANGNLAKALAKALKENGHTVYGLSRSTEAVPYFDAIFEWNYTRNKLDEAAFNGVTSLIHLSGATIAQPWTEKARKTILESRTKTTQLLETTLQRLNVHLKHYIGCSAVGYYGTTTTSTIYDENSPSGTDFLAQVCIQWEQAHQHLKPYAKKHTILRLGVVFDAQEGAFSKVLQPIKKGFGAVLGSGSQHIPWIHIQDVVNAFIWTLEQRKHLPPVLNLVADNTTNKELTQHIAKHIHKTLWLPNVPTLALKLVYGDMACLVLEGSAVSSKALENLGFQFQYKSLEESIKELLEL
jgi:uncharacterized protein